MTDPRVLDRSEFPVLIAAGGNREHQAGETLRRIVAALEHLGHRVATASSAVDAAALVTTDPTFGALVLDWDLGCDGATRPVATILARSARHPVRVPVFLLIGRDDLDHLPLEVEERVQEYVLLDEDTPDFVAGRIDYAWSCYAEKLLPPFFRTLVDFTESHEYSWHTPGHAGGTAFRKSQVGRAFYDFYGETLFRTDLSVSVGELGSLLDHSGAVQDAERNAARVFGADATYFVLNGTSTSNRIVANGSVIAGDVVLADRNCHKSVCHALTLTDARPVYLVPSRNGYGIIGPIPLAAMTEDAVAEAIRRSPLGRAAAHPEPVYAVVTNSTYDGLCYRADRVTDLLGKSSPRVHFDEAWFAYARFHPLYACRYGMHARGPAQPSDPTVFATQSTHKLLASFSQGSMIHMRPSDRAPVEFSRFNEAYMLHGSTSPFYPMIACLDVAAGMMDGAGGVTLVGEAIREAIHFRRQMLRVARSLAEAGDGTPSWFFKPWQPDEVRDPRTGNVSLFEDAPVDLLEREPSCWTLAPGAAWHGFTDLGDDGCLLDPTKVTLTTPGVDALGRRSEHGIPAPVVSLYLDAHRIEVEKTGDYNLLFLFSIGTTRGKWGTLLDGLLGFKRAYDTREPLSRAIPELANAYPDRYHDLTVRDLCDEMHAAMRELGTVRLLDRAFADLPDPVVPPGEAFRRLVRGRTERVPVSEMAARTAAVMVVPYPPGIPILMPGERAGSLEEPVLRYLLALEEFDRRFPGFAHDIHGVERDERGTFLVQCLAEER